MLIGQNLQDCRPTTISQTIGKMEHSHLNAICVMCSTEFSLHSRRHAVNCTRVVLCLCKGVSTTNLTPSCTPPENPITASTMIAGSPSRHYMLVAAVASTVIQSLPLFSCAMHVQVDLRLYVPNPIQWVKGCFRSDDHVTGINL